MKNLLSRGWCQHLKSNPFNLNVGSQGDLQTHFSRGCISTDRFLHGIYMLIYQATSRARLASILDTIQDIFVRVGHETTYAAIGNHNFFTNVIVLCTKNIKDLCEALIAFLYIWHCFQHSEALSFNGFLMEEKPVLTFPARF